MQLQPPKVEEEEERDKRRGRRNNVKRNESFRLHMSYGISHRGQQNTHIFIIISKFIYVIIMSCDWASREMVKLTAGCSLYGTLMLLLHWQIFFCSSICIWIIKKNCKKFTCSCSEVNRRHQKKAVKFIWNLNLIS